MTGAGNRLTGLTKELRAEWDHTKQYWSDAKSAEFEKRFFDELITGVNQAVTNIETLERIIKKIRDDCE